MKRFERLAQISSLLQLFLGLLLKLANDKKETSLQYFAKNPNAISTVPRSKK